MDDARTALIEQSMSNIKTLEKIIAKFKTDLSSEHLHSLSHVFMSTEVLLSYIATSLMNDVWALYKVYSDKMKVDMTVCH